MVKCRHEVGSDFSRLLFGDCVGGILLPGFKDVLKCAAVLGRATVPKQFDGHGWNRQHEVISIVAREGIGPLFPMPEADFINGSFRRCRRLFCFPLCSSAKKPSSSELFHFSPNFDARVRSAASLHRHIWTSQMTCFL